MLGLQSLFHWNASARGRKIDRILLGLALLFGAALIASNWACTRSSFAASDQFDPDLQSIRSVDAAVAYVKGTRTGPDAVATAGAVDAFVRKRFVQGYSQFAPCEDWLAYLAGYLRPDLRNPVLPNDILGHRRAACSQQAIVFQGVARELGLDAGSVRMRGHFASAVRLGGQWRVYDPNQEIEPSSYPLAGLLAGDQAIERTYGEFGRQLDLVGKARTGQIQFGDVNRNPAPRASLFHLVTHFFSHFGWALFLGLYFARHAARALMHDRRRNGRSRAAPARA